MAEFSDRLKLLRKERKITQKELAEIINLSSGAIAMYETGNRTPDKEVLSAIADFFDVSLDYLLGRTDERSPADKIKAAISDDPELMEFWEELQKRDELQLLFKQTKDLDKEGIHQIIRIIKAIEDEEQGPGGGP